MTRIKFYHSLKFQLSMIVLFMIIIPVGLIGTLLANTVQDIFIEKYSDVTLQSVRETSDKINYILEDVTDYTTSMLASRSFLSLASSSKTTDKAMDEALRGYLASRSDIDGISLINQLGTFSIGTNKTTPLISIQQMTKDRNDSEPIWLPTMQQNIKILSGISTRYYFSLVRNIIDFNTLENYGTLVVDVEEVLLRQAYENLSSTGGDVFIATSDGQIISHHDPLKIGTTLETAAYAETLFDGLSLWRTPYGQLNYAIDNEDYFAFYSKIETNDWLIVKTISKDALYGEIDRIQAIFLLGGLIYSVLMIILLLGMSVQYTDPMIGIIKDLKRVEKGDLSARTDVHTNNELRQLGEGVNNMIAEMEVLIDRLIKEERQKREVELEALHAQINPHFLYNTLNTIKWMAKIQGADTVASAIVSLVKLLRVSINISTDFISLGEEIEYIRNYVVIQKLRFNESFEIVVDVPDDLYTLQIPKLILQPIIENSLIHGMDETESLTIRVTAHLERDQLILQVSDNGAGMSDQKVSQIMAALTSVNALSKAGLNNVSQRIKLYCGDAFGLELLTKEGEGTTVVVRLPVKASQENL
ncbi:MAG: sensor histidine kinase [Firmicutes bacterium]|nr:sensor histidine kinase [Bacillota bacterium]